jgi:ATP-dependent Clp protease, protease subunit
MTREMPKMTFGARPDVRADVPTSAVKRWNPALAAAKSGAGTISIMDPIGADIWGDGVTSRRIEGALRSIGDNPVTVTINSPGGDVFEGAAIYELLRQHARERGKVTVQVMGLAASAASLIAMAGDEILIGQSSFFMIHNSWVVAMGDRNAFGEVKDWLAQFDGMMADVYAARSGLEVKKVAGMMDAETWLSATTALDQGFADATLEDAAVVVEHGAENAAASLRAEKKFDLIAARAGITRNDARELLRAVKGGSLDAAATDQPEAVDLTSGVSDILATLKNMKV